MVQIFSEQPMRANPLGQSLGQGLGQFAQRMGQQEQQQQQAGILSRVLGGDLSEMDQLDPQTQMDVYKQRMAVLGKEEKSRSDEDKGLKDYEVIKSTFGEKFADIWKASPTGGQTELVKTGVDALLRGENLEELLKGVEAPEALDAEYLSEGEKDLEKTPQIKNGELPKDFDYPDYAKRPPGYTPKDWRAEQKDWRKENVSIFSENKKKLSSTKRDRFSTKTLDRLNKSKKLPQDLAKVIVDPETGDIRKGAQLAGIASPEAQQWVKEVARFQLRAKDTFGSRVTNFDLMTYMKQFPNLLNTPDGRSRIIKMMDLNYQLDELYQNSLDKVYKKYGLGNIPQESADELAQELIEDQKSNLESEYLKASEGIQVVSSLKNEGYKKGDKAGNPETGEVFIFNGKEWEKSQ